MHTRRVAPRLSIRPADEGRDTGEGIGDDGERLSAGEWLLVGGMVVLIFVGIATWGAPP